MAQHRSWQWSAYLVPGGLGNDCARTAAFAAIILIAQAAVGAVIGNNFTGTNLSQSGFIPPDSMGAIGTDHFVELINGAYAVYSKATGSLVGSRLTLNSFWNTALASGGGGVVDEYTSDPRVIYDQASGRWFAAAIDTNSGNSNSFLVAVSQSSNPTQGWKGFKIDADPNNNLFADFPCFGVDADGVYLTSNNFSVTLNTLQSVSIISIPKADLLLATPSVANRTMFLGENENSRGYAIQPAVDFGASTGAATLLAVDIPFFNRFNRTTVLNSGVQSPGAASLSSSTNITVTTSDPPLARQPDGSQNLDGGDYRIASMVYKVGTTLWSVHGISSGGRAAIRWEKINATNGSVIQQGTINDANFDFIYPSICANSAGDVVIGFTRMGNTQSPSTYAVIGTTTTSTTFGAPFLLKAGVTGGSYHVTFNDPTDRNRWGDYSATTLDPTDPGIFWTTQEWQSFDDPQSASVVDQNDQWSTQITEIIPTKAGEVRWAPATNGNFATGTNWLSGSIASTSDHAIFSRPTDPASSGYTVSFNAGATTDRLSVRQGAVAFDLGGHTYAVTDLSQVSRSITIGEFAGTSQLTILNGTLSTVHAAIAPGTFAAGQVTVGAGGIWNSSGSVFIGGSSAAAAGSGTLTVQTGGAVNLDTAGQQLKVWPTGMLNLAGGTIGGAASIDVQGALNLTSISEKSGAGTMTVNGPISWGSGAQINVQGSSGGKLIFNAVSGSSVSVADNTAQILVEPGATLELAGSLSATSSGGNFVNIQNDSTTSFKVTGTNQQVGNVDGLGNTTIAANANLVAGRIVQNSLAIQGTSGSPNAAVTVRRSGGNPQGLTSQVSVVNTLSLANNGAVIDPPPSGGYSAAERQYFGKLDLVNNDLIIRGGSPALFVEVQDMIRAGLFTEGARGITSQEALTSGEYAGMTWLGALYNAIDDDYDPMTPDVPVLSSFDGVSLSGGEIILKYTWFGDADLDGLVTNLDFGLLLAGLGGSDPNQASNPWIFGDFDYSGLVDSLDYGLLLSGIAAGGDSIELPEPGTLVLATMGALTVLAYGIRQRKRGIIES